MPERKIFDVSPVAGDKKSSPPSPPLGRMVVDQKSDTPTSDVLSVHKSPSLAPLSSTSPKPQDEKPKTTLSPAADVQPPLKEVSSDVSPRGLPVDDKQLPPQAVQQVPKIFDAGTYHLPIQKRSKASSGRFMAQFIVIFLLLLAVMVVAAIDAGWLDVGVSLPFDIL